MVPFEDFAKLDIRIVKILEAQRIEGSDKLLKLIVNAGDETRQILAGIGKSFEPENLIGKEVVAIINLEPRKIMGEESQGMLLATGDDLENITLLHPHKEVPPGSKIR